MPRAASERDLRNILESEHDGNNSITCGDEGCELDTVARRLRRGGQVIKLSPSEYELLHYFLTKSRRALSRDQILNDAWGYDCLVTPRSIDRFVTALRQKIERDAQQPQFILTVREYGYKLVLESPEG